VRIVIAEDTVLLREGLAGLLEDAGHEVVARVGDAEALLAVVAEHEPDLAVVDVRMPPDYEDEGMRAAADIRRAHPAPPFSSSRNMSRRAMLSSSSRQEAASAICSSTVCSTWTTSLTPLGVFPREDRLSTRRLSRRSSRSRWRTRLAS
jgi:DNA-binding NarL/FixJ family response regulator